MKQPDESKGLAVVRALAGWRKHSNKWWADRKREEQLLDLQKKLICELCGQDMRICRC